MTVRKLLTRPRPVPRGRAFLPGARPALSRPWVRSLLWPRECLRSGLGKPEELTNPAAFRGIPCADRAMIHREVCGRSRSAPGAAYGVHAAEKTRSVLDRAGFFHALTAVAPAPSTLNPRMSDPANATKAMLFCCVRQGFLFDHFDPVALPNSTKLRLLFRLPGVRPPPFVISLHYWGHFVKPGCVRGRSGGGAPWR